MLILLGRIVNIYENPTGTNKETGEQYGGQHRVQLMAENTLRNGETRHELVDLTVRDVRPFHELRDQDVHVPVGVFSTPQGVRFFHRTGGDTEPVSPAHP